MKEWELIDGFCSWVGVSSPMHEQNISGICLASENKKFKALGCMCDSMLLLWENVVFPSDIYSSWKIFPWRGVFILIHVMFFVCLAENVWLIIFFVFWWTSIGGLLMFQSIGAQTALIDLC